MKQEAEMDFAPMEEAWDEDMADEDLLNEEAPWEIAFERGERLATEKLMEENWAEDDEW
jgi:hypothetical protein